MSQALTISFEVEGNRLVASIAGCPNGGQWSIPLPDGRVTDYELKGLALLSLIPLARTLGGPCVSDEAHRLLDQAGEALKIGMC